MARLKLFGASWLAVVNRYFPENNEVREVNEEWLNGSHTCSEMVVGK